MSNSRRKRCAAIRRRCLPFKRSPIGAARLRRWTSCHQGELALKIAREIGQRSDEAYTLIHMSMCLGPQGEYARALEQAQHGLALAEDIEHYQWMTAGHWALGVLYFDLLVLPTAQQHLEQALALAHEIGSQFFIRIVSGLLARVALAQ